MMDQLDSELRRGLERLADDGDTPVDVEAVISAGDALRRRRWTRGLTGGVVLAAAAVVLGWPALAGGPVPAVPDPLGSPTPSSSPSASGTVSAELSYPGGRVEVWRDHVRGVWGYHDYANDTHTTMPLDTLPVGSIVGLAGTAEGDYFLRLTAIGLLPPGGTNPEFELPHDGITWTAADLRDTGQVVFLVKADRIRQITASCAM